MDGAGLQPLSIGWMLSPGISSQAGMGRTVGARVCCRGAGRHLPPFVGNFVGSYVDWPVVGSSRQPIEWGLNSTKIPTKGGMGVEVSKDS